jgi:hypothetical protein
MARTWPAVVVCVLALSHGAEAGGGDDSLLATLEEIAEDVGRHCRRQMIERITPPEVLPAAGKAAGGLDRIAVPLEQKLKDGKRKLEVKAMGGATLTVRVRVGKKSDPLKDGHAYPVTELLVTLVRAGDDALLMENVRYSVRGVALALEVAGATGDIHAPSGEKIEARAVEVITGKPKATIDGTAVLAGKEFGLEVLRDGKPVKPADDDGLAFVELGKGRYTVRLINRAKYEVAVDLRIDGLNVFAPPGKPPAEPSLIVVKPGEPVTVPGWYSGKKFHAFEVGTLHPDDPRRADDLRRRLRTITASFHRCWPAGAEAPDDEAPKTLGAGDETGTLVGAPVEGAARDVKRDFGRVRGVVSVRYNLPKAR